MIIRKRKHRSSSNQHPSKKAYHEREAAKKRIVLEGYPAIQKQMNLNEIKNYFSHEKITCLLCGKLYHELGYHLKRIHGVSVDDYKIMYGLPQSRGLTGWENHSKKSETAKKLVEEGIIGTDFKDLDRKSISSKKRKNTGYITLLNKEKNKNFLKTKELVNYQIQCQNCLEIFSSKRKNKKFCSQKCCKELHKKNGTLHRASKLGGQKRRESAMRDE